mmetsp:Transcript_24097/g.45046  ORF Transcript_24097/g.45046 Transcript_24097/m.45046 type:complete len:160 (+) Transcript_24097:1000-1479(+)
MKDPFKKKNPRTSAIKTGEEDIERQDSGALLNVAGRQKSGGKGKYASASYNYKSGTIRRLKKEKRDRKTLNRLLKIIVLTSSLCGLGAFFLIAIAIGGFASDDNVQEFYSPNRELTPSYDASLYLPIVACAFFLWYSWVCCPEYLRCCKGHPSSVVPVD